MNIKNLVFADSILTPQKKETLLTKYAERFPQFGWVGADVMEIWRTTFAGYTHFTFNYLDIFFRQPVKLVD
jgi:glycerol kinase